MALDLFDTLASERASSGTTTNPLIFIAHGCGVQVVSRALGLVNGFPTAKGVSFELILDLTYGVVFVPSRRHRLVRALILATGQLACYIMLRNYKSSWRSHRDLHGILTGRHGYIKECDRGNQDIKIIIQRRDMQSCRNRGVQPGKSCHHQCATKH